MKIRGGWIMAGNSRLTLSEWPKRPNSGIKVYSIIPTQLNENFCIELGTISIFERRFIIEK